MKKESPTEGQLREALNAICERMWWSLKLSKHWWLLGETARSVKDGWLSGDCIHVGAGEKSLNGRTKELLEKPYGGVYHNPKFVSEDENWIVLNYKDVPIKIQKIHGTYDCFTFADVTFYPPTRPTDGKYLDYELYFPNPLSQYLANMSAFS